MLKVDLTASIDQLEQGLLARHQAISLMSQQQAEMLTMLDAMQASKDWADTHNHDPNNLTTLCWFHHHVVAHGLGHRLDTGSPPQRRRFLRNHASGADPP